MTTIPDEAVWCDDELPSLARVLKVAAGREAWSATELEIRARKPAWHVREAQGHLALAMLVDSPTAATTRLKEALECVRRMPNRRMREAACRYLRTFLSVDLQPRFDQLSQADRAATRRRTFLTAGCATAAAASGLVVWLSYFRQNAPQTSAAAPPLLVLLFPTNTPKGVGKTYYADDVLHYRRSVTTRRRFLWLVTVDEAQASIRDYVERPDQTPQTVQLETKRKFDARDCWEFFIIVVADEPILPRPVEPDRGAVKLAWTDEERQQLQACGADEAAAAKLVATRLEAEYRQRVEVFVSSVRRESTVR
ncbi:MAG: hypothetical protein JNK76_07305 [Planctomycetales bacterium]|nr:hypothetical protein [Planctomycetales bacterium]MBN8628269.1 hypothetical protein [Planctomycetota bacterium]